MLWPPWILKMIGVWNSIQVHQLPINVAPVRFSSPLAKHSLASLHAIFRLLLFWLFTFRSMILRYTIPRYKSLLSHTLILILISPAQLTTINFPPLPSFLLSSSLTVYLLPPTPNQTNLPQAFLFPLLLINDHLTYPQHIPSIPPSICLSLPTTQRSGSALMRHVGLPRVVG